MEKAVELALDFEEKGLIHDPDKDPSPLTPSGAIPIYLKPGRNG